ncbi:MAG TPA: hypothetical protein VK762_08075 [Polyangiaceae bacterium]|jgi:hypothetical protein|nr:hypothetical protein [Polyangiaceae bacterium]
MPTLRSQLDSLAAAFASAVVDAIRGASLHELVATDGRPAPAARAASGPAAKPIVASKTTRSGRLKRRSSEDIGQVLDQIVSLVKKNKDGLRAEQIRTELGLQAKELPRVLKEGLRTKRLRKAGQKRATVYSAR